MKIQVGVLSIIGSFAEHEESLKKAFAAGRLEGKWKEDDLEVIRLISENQLTDSMDGLIIPGGESTTMSAFLRRGSFLEMLKSWVNKQTKFCWGTCAGMILLSDEVVGGEKLVKIGGIDIVCKRNAYGRQNNSAMARFEINEDGIKSALSNPANSNIFDSALIRAPAVQSIGSDDVIVLSQALDELDPALHRSNAVQHENKMATAFHPELTDELRWHAYFIDQVIKRKKTS